MKYTAAMIHNAAHTQSSLDPLETLTEGSCYAVEIFICTLGPGMLFACRAGRHAAQSGA